MKFKLLVPLIWIFLCLIFFYPVFLGKLPAPLDTIVGLYHPFREVVWNELTAGVPFKNFLITDPVRQQIPWRFLGVESISKLQFLSWNPYSFSGTPLTANIQSAVFYPLNILFFIFPFIYSWSLLIILTPVLSGLFMYLYLRTIKLSKESSFIGSLAFAFSGFMIAWMEWGTLGQVLLWLPLILTLKEKILLKFSWKWLILLSLSEVSMLLAGHVQISVYVVIFSTIYLITRLISYHDSKKVYPFLLNALIVFILIIPQYYSFFQFVRLSARSYDLPDWQASSWFLPINQTIQFIAPDFFGNPSTLNYWGEWNYGEFIAYIGIVPLILYLIALVMVKNNLSLFYKLSVVVILLLIIRNPVSEIPFKLRIPFLDSAQPTRMLSILVFCASVLSAYGFDYLMSLKNNQKEKRLWLCLLFPVFIILILWLITIKGPNLEVSQRNLILPTFFVITSAVALYSYLKVKTKVLLYFLIIVTFVDLFRFGHKYLSFSSSQYFYPQTKTIEFLNSQQKPFRIMTIDRRIMPPNFSIMYKLQDVSGYDPLYLLRYGTLVNSWQNNNPAIYPGRFNRIITPENYDSFITDLLNVKYILSLSDINSSKLKLVFTEGETRIYENINVLPRAFLVNRIVKAEDDHNEVDLMFQNQSLLSTTAISQSRIDVDGSDIREEEKAVINNYSENNIEITVNTSKTRLLLLSDIYYPGWIAYVDDNPVNIYQVDYLLRAVIVPEGLHKVNFEYKFKII